MMGWWLGVVGPVMRYRHPGPAGIADDFLLRARPSPDGMRWCTFC